MCLIIYWCGGEGRLSCHCCHTQIHICLSLNQRRLAQSPQRVSVSSSPLPRGKSRQLPSRIEHHWRRFIFVFCWCFRSKSIISYDQGLHKVLIRYPTLLEMRGSKHINWFHRHHLRIINGLAYTAVVQTISGGLFDLLVVGLHECSNVFSICRSEGVELMSVNID